MYDFNSEIGRQYLFEEYVVKQRSAKEIAEDNETYPNKVRRALILHGIPTRDLGEAQRLALENGRAPHPTAGEKRPAETRKKISERVSEQLESDPAELARRAELGREQWEKKSESEKEEMARRAGEGLRRAAKEGSRLEHYLLAGLQAAGYVVDYHKTFLIANEDMHIDLYLPKEKTAVEVDGPTHFRPIWGEEKLVRVINADRVKTGLLLQAGLRLIRVKSDRAFSEARARKTLDKLFSALKEKAEYQEVEV